MSTPNWAPPPTATPPPKKHTARNIFGGCLGVVLLIVIAIVVIAVAGGSGKSSQSASNPVASNGARQPVSNNDGAAHPAAADVKITDCGNDTVLGMPQAKVSITNHSGKSSDYLVTIEFLAKNGTRIAQGIATQDNIAPGQTAVTDVSPDNQGTADSCRLVTVDRTQSQP